MHLKNNENKASGFDEVDNYQNKISDKLALSKRQ
jgi:hypothetical protein